MIPDPIITFSGHSEFFVIALDQMDFRLLVGGALVLTVLVLVAIFTDKFTKFN